MSVLDINGLRLSQERVKEYLKEQAGYFHIYGISGLITTYKYQKWLIKTIRKHFKGAIICGGGCATAAGDLLENAGANRIIKGAGENKLPTYLIKPNRYKSIDDIPFPDWADFPMDVYLKNRIWGKDAENSSDMHPDMTQERSANTITSKGCPYSCNFCYDLFGKNYKQRSVENVIKEIKELKQLYNIDFIGFVDDNMFVNKKWVLDFCNKIKEEYIYWGCHARVNEVDDEVLESAYNSGCRWIGYGIESGSQKILDNMNKRTTVEQAKRAIELTRKYNIYPNTTFIYGYPGETSDTVTETIKFCTEMGLKPTFFYATPYPLTNLYKVFKSKIMALFGDFETYVEYLGDAKDFLINLTDMSNKEFFRQKERLEGALN